MRIASRVAFDASVLALQQRQEALAQSQEQLTTGKRIARAGDDPAAAARAERALAGVGRSETAQRAIDASVETMGLTEAAIGDAIALLQEARETVIVAGNDGALADGERRSIADKLRSLRHQLFGVANRDDGAGRHLFGGQGASTVPFVDAPGGVQFVATPGTQQTDTGLPVTSDGRATFMSAPTGNGVFETRAVAGVTQAWIGPGSVSDPTALTGSSYTLQFSVAPGGATTYAVLRDGAPTAITAAPYVDGADITVDGMTLQVQGAPADGDRFDVVPSQPSASAFDVLDAAAAEIATPNRTGAQRAQSISDSLRDIDSVLRSLQAQRTRAGEALNRADMETDRQSDLKLSHQKLRSAAEDLDMTAAISEFQSRQTGYDAALKSYSMVQKLSLFNYLG